MKSNKGASIVGYISSFAIGAILLIAVFNQVFDFQLIKKIKANLPNFLLENKNTTIENYGFNCSLTVGYVKDDYVFLCTDNECSNRYESKIYFSGDNIYVDINWATDPQIGLVQNGRFLYFNDNLVNWKEDSSGTIERIQGSVNLDDVLKLEGAYFSNSARNTICRNGEGQLESFRAKQGISIRKVNVDQHDYWFNMDEFLQNILKNEITPMYNDPELKHKVNTYLKPDKKIIRVHETIFEDNYPEGERSISELFEHNDQKLESMQIILGKKIILSEGTASEIFDLKEKISSKDSYYKLGPYVGQAPLAWVQYIKKNDYVYLRFIGWGGDKEATPYILQDYWNAYRSFDNVPRWAKPDFEKK